MILVTVCMCASSPVNTCNTARYSVQYYSLFQSCIYCNLIKATTLVCPLDVEFTGVVCVWYTLLQILFIDNVCTQWGNNLLGSLAVTYLSYKYYKLTLYSEPHSHTHTHTHPRPHHTHRLCSGCSLLHERGCI